MPLAWQEKLLWLLTRKIWSQWSCIHTTTHQTSHQTRWDVMLLFEAAESFKADNRSCICITLWITRRILVIFFFFPNNSYLCLSHAIRNVWNPLSKFNEQFFTKMLLIKLSIYEIWKETGRWDHIIMESQNSSDWKGLLEIILPTSPCWPCSKGCWIPLGMETPQQLCSSVESPS